MREALGLGSADCLQRWLGEQMQWRSSSGEWRQQRTPPRIVLHGSFVDDS
jgi:hypothetical protein